MITTLFPIWYMNPSHLTQKSVKLIVTVQKFRELQFWKKEMERQKEAPLHHFCGKCVAGGNLHAMLQWLVEVSERGKGQTQGQMSDVAIRFIIPSISSIPR